MSREIKFRGKRKDLINNEWYYGFLIIEPNGTYWIDYFVDSKRRTAEIKKESVGQYTGLKDCKGNEIYEGDIISMENVYGKIYGLVGFESGKFVYTQKYIDKKNSFLSTNESTYDLSFNVNPYVVIGNIHENPELLN